VADVVLYLVEAGAEGRVGLCGAGVPQPEGDVAGGDEVIDEGQIARQRPVLGAAADEGVAELAVAGAVP